jgi:hypothetical protein
MYKFVSIDTPDGISSSAPHFAWDHNSVNVFIGGLFHVVGQDNGPGLINLLASLKGEETGVGSSFLVEETPTDWTAKLPQVFEFIHQRFIRYEIQQLVHVLLLPKQIVEPMIAAVSTRTTLKSFVK